MNSNIGMAKKFPSNGRAKVLKYSIEENIMYNN